MEQQTSFGEWLTRCRQSLHLQRAELAARIGCAAVTLRKIEADERRPSRQLAERLADELAIPPQWREVFIRVARGELPVARLAPPRAPDAGPTHLPSPTTSLAGRAREVEEIRGLLSRPDVRLLTLTGAPGVGKSRLALEAAQALRDTAADGVFFVALAPLSDPDLVLVTVAHALHVAATGRQPLAARDPDKDVAPGQGDGKLLGEALGHLARGPALVRLDLAQGDDRAADARRQFRALQAQALPKLREPCAKRQGLLHGLLLRSVAVTRGATRHPCFITIVAFCRVAGKPRRKNCIPFCITIRATSDTTTGRIGSTLDTSARDQARYKIHRDPGPAPMDKRRESTSRGCRPRQIANTMEVWK